MADHAERPCRTARRLACRTTISRHRPILPQISVLLAIPRDVSVAAMEFLTAIAISNISAIEIKITPPARPPPLRQIAVKGRPQDPRDQFTRQPATPILAYISRRRLFQTRPLVAVSEAAVALSRLRPCASVASCLRPRPSATQVIVRRKVVGLPALMESVTRRARAEVVASIIKPGKRRV